MLESVLNINYPSQKYMKFILFKSSQSRAGWLDILFKMVFIAISPFKGLNGRL